MTSDSRAAAPSGPHWSLPRGLIVLLGLAGMVVTIGGLRVFVTVIAPTALALMLTVAVHPFPAWLRRKGLPGWLATIVALLCVYGILLILLLSLVVSVARLATILPRYTDRLNELITNVKAALQDQGVGPDQIRQVLSQIDASTVVHLVEKLLQSGVGIF